jgi:hypothetical protein
MIKNYKKKYIDHKVWGNIGHLLYFRRHSNIFVVLLNYKRKHVVTLTSGSCQLGKKKKEKLAVHKIPLLVTKLLEYLHKGNITALYFYVRHRLSGHFFSLRWLLMKNNIYIKSLNYILKKPHGFFKKRKLRRI